MIIPIRSLLPNAADVLDRDLEVIGPLLLRHLKSCEGVSPIFQHGGINFGYFLAIMERRNIGLGPLPNNGPEYGTQQAAVSRAFVEAQAWLVMNGFLIRNHQQPAELYLITRKGEKLLEDTLRKDLPVQAGHVPTAREGVGPTWDIFISHASEDKSYVDPLADALRSAGVSVWYDTIVLTWGDDLRPKIDEGLRNCRFGIVVLSRAFLGKKKWTEHELNGLFARERAGQKLVLPIWHGITRDDLLEYSPALADRLAKISDTDSNDDIVTSVLALIAAPNIAPDSAVTLASKAHQDLRVAFPSPLPRRAPAGVLDPREIELLWNAAQAGEIVHSSTLDGEALRAGQRQFLDGANARTAAEWLGALRRLESGGLVEPLDIDRESFRVTDEGYRAADQLDGFIRWNTRVIVLRAHYLNAPSRDHSVSCTGIIATPAVYFPQPDNTSAPRSLKECRALLVEGIDQNALPAWQPTDVEFRDESTDRVERFQVDGFDVIRPARLKLPIVT